MATIEQDPQRNALNIGLSRKEDAIKAMCYATRRGAFVEYTRWGRVPILGATRCSRDRLGLPTL